MSAAQAAATRSREADVGLRINHHSTKIRLNFRPERIIEKMDGIVSNFFFFFFFFLLENREKLYPCLSPVPLSSKFFVLSYFLIEPLRGFGKIRIDLIGDTAKHILFRIFSNLTCD